jgi:hypothetical protein
MAVFKSNIAQNAQSFKFRSDFKKTDFITNKKISRRIILGHQDGCAGSCDYLVLKEFVKKKNLLVVPGLFQGNLTGGYRLCPVENRPVYNSICHSDKEQENQGVED